MAMCGKREASEKNGSEGRHGCKWECNTAF